MPASIGSPGVDDGAFELWVSSGVGACSYSKRCSAGPSSQTTTNLLSQWKVSPVTVLEENKMASYDRPRRVTWA